MNRLLVASLSSFLFVSQTFPVLADERPFVPRYTTVTRTTEARTTSDYPERRGYRRNNDADNSGGYQQPPAPNTNNATAPILAGVAGLAIGALLFGHHGGGGNSGGNTSTTNSNNTTIVTTNNINTNTAVSHHNGYQPDQADPQSQPVQYQAQPQQHHWSRNTLPVNDAPAYAADSDLPATGGPFVVRDGDAPADEYFGSMNMSVLGIRNSITDTNARAVGSGEETGHGLLHRLLFTEQAFHDWQRKYPNDNWIVTNGYELVDDFQKLDVETSDENPHVASIHAIDLENWLDATYPGNQYASK
jgi:hypothetical protein